MMKGQKHLISCRCVLPQFKSKTDPPVHKFIVFSSIDDSDNVVSKFAQCNNCGLVHKVTDICKSTILQGKESFKSILSIDDIKMSVPNQLSVMLEKHNADLPTWEHVSFILENKLWGDHVVLTSEIEDNVKHGKYVRILGENLYKVESFSTEQYFEE